MLFASRRRGSSDSSAADTARRSDERTVAVAVRCCGILYQPPDRLTPETGCAFAPSPSTPGEGWGEGLPRRPRDVVLEEGPHPALSRRTGRGNESRTSR